MVDWEAVVHIKSLSVKNFRAIEDISIDFDNLVNVIVGPNAIGKTTILEAMRLVKAVLSPRGQMEGMQALVALGASSPHTPQQIYYEALARNTNQEVSISVRYLITTEEMAWIEGASAHVARGLVQERMGQSLSNPISLINYYSTPQGKAALSAAEDEVRKAIEEAKRDGGTCKVELKIIPGIGPNSNGASVWPSMIAALDQRFPPSISCFSYFPADRALPQGETPVQLGAVDAQNQIQSHNSQPQTKYARLKNTIFNSLVMNESGREEISAEFEKIFSGILKGRRLIGFGLNHIGFLSLKVEEIETGRTFDMDGMSSGEKGLILTFLLIAKSVSDNSIILLDEPELHLNPAVCKDLLSFLVDEYATKKNMQVFVCSHSPEILAGAFDNDKCSLYHLISKNMLTKVRIQDQEIVAEALRRLGTSESDGLLYKGTIFVEGVDDVAALEAGFSAQLRRYKIKELGGRREVEKLIKLLQQEEIKGYVTAPRYFIFDRDHMPTDLESTESVKILQWERRSLENYLIEIDILSDLLMDGDVVTKPLNNTGEVTRLIKKLAFEQIIDISARQVYLGYKYMDAGLRAAEIVGKPLDEIANILGGRLADIKEQISSYDESGWRSKYIHECDELSQRLTSEWEMKWTSDCDGKRLFADLCKHVQPKHGPRKFKVRLINEMRIAGSENWVLINQLLNNLMSAD